MFFQITNLGQFYNTWVVRLYVVIFEDFIDHFILPFWRAFFGGASYLVYEGIKPNFPYWQARNDTIYNSINIYWLYINQFFLFSLRDVNTLVGHVNNFVSSNNLFVASELLFRALERAVNIYRSLSGDTGQLLLAGANVVSPDQEV